MISEATSRHQTGRFEGKVAIVTGGSQDIGEAHGRRDDRPFSAVGDDAADWDSLACDQVSYKLANPNSADRSTATIDGRGRETASEPLLPDMRKKPFCQL
jgi:hypothetical protein